MKHRGVNRQDKQNRISMKNADKRKVSPKTRGKRRQAPLAVARKQNLSPRKVWRAFKLHDVGQANESFEKTCDDICGPRINSEI